jgi:hypothetical protein
MCNCNQKTATMEEILAARIPDELHAQVIELANKTYRVLTIDEVTLTAIFKIWNTYVDREDQDMTCSACRMRVVGRFRQIAQVYAGRIEQ